MASSVDLVVQIRKYADGRRRVIEIVGIPGRVEGDVVEVSDIFITACDRLVRADGFPPHRDRFAGAGFDLTALLCDEQAA